MSTFYKKLKEENLTKLLHRVEFNHLTFSTEEKVYSFLDDLRMNKKRAFIYGDYDADGLYSAKIYACVMDLLGIDYDIYNYRERTHELDYYAVIECIRGLYDYFLVADTASSDLDSLELLTSYGIKVIVLDHHHSIYNYNDFPYNVAIINTTFENRIAGEDIYKMSAGGLVYYVMSKYLKRIGVDEPTDMVVYGAITLYSDCMDMCSDYNRAIYYKALEVGSNKLPENVRVFMNDYTIFRSRFISYNLVPRISAMFRSENLCHINKLFFDKNITFNEKIDTIRAIDTIYTANRDMVAIVADCIECEELEHFVLADLWSINDHVKVLENKLYNYTGLIASKLSERYGKTAVVYCLVDDHYKGSVRDVFGRGYRSLFKQLCYAEGHDPAFGLLINYLEFADFKKNLKRIDKHFYLTDSFNSPIIVDVGTDYPDDVLINDMAIYNEFAGQTAPIAYIRRTMVGDIGRRRTSYYYMYNWGGFSIQSNYAIPLYDTVLLKPICAKSSPRLVATTDLRVS